MIIYLKMIMSTFFKYVYSESLLAYFPIYFSHSSKLWYLIHHFLFCLLWLVCFISYPNFFFCLTPAQCYSPMFFSRSLLSLLNVIFIHDTIFVSQFSSMYACHIYNKDQFNNYFDMSKKFCLNT